MHKSLQALPGGELVLKGLEDYKGGRDTVESYLVHIASPALVKANLLSEISDQKDSEIRLYRLLQGQVSNPYSMFNSLMRRLISFEKTLALMEK